MSVERPEKTIIGAIGVHLFLLAYLVIFFATISDYGIGWDSALGELYLGDSSLYYLGSQDSTYLELDTNKIGVYQRKDHPDFFIHSSYMRSHSADVWGFGPLVSAISKHVLYTKSGLLDPIDAHHAVLGLLGVLLLSGLYFFAVKYLDQSAALAAVLVLALYPRFWAHLHNNIKDIPAMLLFTATVTAFFHGFRRQHLAWLSVAALLGGFALSAKANAFFIPIILFPVLISECLRRRRLGEIPLPRRTMGLFLLYPLLVLPPLYLAWPYVFKNFPSNLEAHFAFLIERAGSGPEGWQIDPLLKAFFATPLFSFFLFVLGLATALRMYRHEPEKRPLLIFMTLWLLVPVGRVSLPRALDFDGIRHWIEFLPAFALFCGLGFSALRRVLQQSVLGEGVRERVAAMLLLCLGFAPTVLWSVKNHPFQLVYFNSVIGGFGGAQESDFPDSSDYWANSYRLTYDWLNKQLPENSLLLTGVAEHTVQLMAKTRLRSDIETRTLHHWRRFVPREAAKGRPVYLMYITRPEWYQSLIPYVEAIREPELSIEVDGGVLLKVYRIS